MLIFGSGNYYKTFTGPWYMIQKFQKQDYRKVCKKKGAKIF